MLECCQNKSVTTPLGGELVNNCEIKKEIKLLKEEINNLKNRFDKLVVDLEKILNGPFSYDSTEYLETKGDRKIPGKDES